MNVFLRFTYDPAWTVRYRRLTPEFSKWMQDTFTEGSEGHALCPQLNLQPGDLTLNKTRLSALTPGTCDLEAVLRGRGVDTLIVTGCFSNACCESTVRDAMQLNYNVVFVADANVTVSDAAHNAAVEDLYCIFGCDVCASAEVIRRLSGG